MPFHATWRVLFAVTPLLAVGQILVSGVLFESPRWLLRNDPKSLRARYVIKRLRGLRNEDEVEREVSFFLGGASVQDPTNKTNTTSNTTSSSTSTTTTNVHLLREIWNDTKRRKLLITCLVLPMAQQLSGINAIIYYSGAFFEGIIEDPLVGTVIVFGVK